MLTILLALALSALTTELPDDGRPVAVAFLGAQCPLGKLYANRIDELAREFPDVAFVVVVPGERDSDEQIAELAHGLAVRVIRDPSCALVDRFGATRSPEVFLLDADERVVYQGRIDDQYEPGIHSRGAPRRRDLALAIAEVLSGRPVSVPRTVATGCRIDRGPATASSGEITYSEQIAAIVDRRCVECHRPGQAAPFSLQTYQDVAAWTDTIREVIEQRRMPPWGAKGHFANDRSLTDAERATILSWLDAGAPQGDRAARPAAPSFAPGWSIEPDFVFAAPEFVVPAEGVLEYQEFVIDPGFSADTWVQAIEVMPGNRSVVHHINVCTRPKSAAPHSVFVNDLGDLFLATAVPGNWKLELPAGCAKMIPAGANLVLSVHYVPNGRQQTDRSRVAFRQAKSVQHQVASRVLLDNDLVIAPRERKTAVQRWTLEDDYTLLALYPHMHLRGKSMLIVAEYPDKTRETLLDVYRYDFAWQFRYVLAEPKQLPRGTVITCTALFDNSSDNPTNPDPAAVVRAGPHTTDEMFQATFDVYRTNDRAVSRATLALVVVGIAIAVLFLSKSSSRRAAQRVRPTEAESAASP